MAQQLLARYRRATDAPFAPGMYHLRYRTVANDGNVTISDFFWARGRRPEPDFRAILSENGVRYEQGRFSGHSWERSANGLVVRDTTSPTIFDRVLVAAYRKPDPRVRMLGVTRTSPHEYVLEVRPNVHLLQRLYFDERECLLRESITQDYDGRVAVTKYFNYARIGGRLFPSTTVYFDNLSARRMETTLVDRARLAYNPSFMSIPASHTPFAVQYRLPATLNSIFESSGILVRADINGSPYWLELDSGARGVTLDSSLAEDLGLRAFGKYVSTKGGPVEMSIAVLPRIDVGPVYAKNLVVGVLPYRRVFGGVHVVGLLGCDFIGSRPLAIDLDKQTVTAVSATPAPTNGYWASLPAPLHACIPTINVDLEGHRVTLVLDFGSTNSTLNADVLERLGRAPLQLDRTRLDFIGGEVDATHYAIPRASVGPLELGPLLVSVSDDGRGQDLDNDGILGRNVLNNFSVILDYAHQRIYVHRHADQ
jgi:predicted aspartyl protease